MRPHNTRRQTTARRDGVAFDRFAVEARKHFVRLAPYFVTDTDKEAARMIVDIARDAYCLLPATDTECIRHKLLVVAARACDLWNKLKKN
jgi:hypothetical protein